MRNDFYDLHNLSAMEWSFKYIHIFQNIPAYKELTCQLPSGHPASYISQAVYSLIPQRGCVVGIHQGEVC